MFILIYWMFCQALIDSAQRRLVLYAKQAQKVQTSDMEGSEKMDPSSWIFQAY